MITDTYFSQELKSLSPITAGFFYIEKSRDTYRVERLDRYAVKYYCCITNKVYDNMIPPDHNLIFPFKIVASHNGFVLCVELRRNSPHFLVCNPYTKQWLVLPQNADLHDVCASHTVLFCYEKQGSATVEFKVLSFQFPRFSIILQVHIYSSETRKWTVSEGRYLRKPKKILLGSDFVYLWHHLSSKVVVYDLNGESSRFMKLPSKDEKFNKKNYLGVSAGSVYYAEICDSSVFLWVHDREDEWSLKHVVPFGTLNANIRLFGFHPMKLGFIMELNGPGIRLYGLYDVDKRKMEDFPYFHPDKRVVPYMLPEWLPSLKNSWSVNQGGEECTLTRRRSVLSLIGSPLRLQWLRKKSLRPFTPNKSFICRSLEAVGAGKQEPRGRVWRSPLSLHDSTESVVHDNSAYHVNFPAL